MDGSLESLVDYFLNNKIQAKSLKLLRGVERETLRVTKDGQISQKDHPAKLGSALTNRYVTTDYSEALLEFVTPTFERPEEIFKFLEDVHGYTYKEIDSELLWPLSMPPKIKEEEIRIAEFGPSNMGRLKHLYRVGLKNRYGSLMQVISGIHYNFSASNDFFRVLMNIDGIESDSKSKLIDYKNNCYLSLIRNVQRYSPIITYLFGASPAMAANLLNNRPTELKDLSNDTIYSPFATSLRMSDLGYQNDGQKHLKVCYNHLNNYIRDLQGAMTTPHDNWKKYKNGVEQISDAFLQIENEYYNIIRPKPILYKGERPTIALKRRGIEYVELRMLDNNPLSPVGLDIDQLYFLDIFTLFCLLEKSHKCAPSECLQIQKNYRAVAYFGRSDELLLSKGDSFKDWMTMVYLRFLGVATLLDQIYETKNYVKAFNKYKGWIEDQSLTLSSSILKCIEKHDNSLQKFGKHRADEIKKEFQKKEYNVNIFENEAQASLEELASINSQKSIPFDEFVQRYVTQMSQDRETTP